MTNLTPASTSALPKLAGTTDNELWFRAGLRRTELEREWDDLMLLCLREKEYRAEQSHRVLVKVLARRIDDLARHMGFSETQIQARNFKAEKTDGRITSIVTE